MELCGVNSRVVTPGHHYDPADKFKQMVESGPRKGQYFAQATAPQSQGTCAAAVIVAIRFLLPGTGVQSAPKRVLPYGARMARVVDAELAWGSGSAGSSARPPP